METHIRGNPLCQLLEQIRVLTNYIFMKNTDLLCTSPTMNWAVQRRPDFKELALGFSRNKFFNRTA